jgi:hypothetical protein
MRCSSKQICYLVAALITSAIPASAQTRNYAPANDALSYGRSDHERAITQELQRIDSRQSRRMETQDAHSEIDCRARYSVQTWDYDGCIQRLPASAMVGGHQR